MSQSDIFDRMLVSLSDAALNDALWPSTAALIDEACGLTGNELVIAETPNDDPKIYLSRFFYRGLRRRDLERIYFKIYYPEDERVPRARALTDSKLVHVTELLTDKELKTSRTYNEALALSGGQNALVVRLDGPDGLGIIWEFANTVYSDGWGSVQVEMIRRLLPHMRHYVRVRHSLSTAEALGVSLTELLENTRVGVIHLDRRGRIVAVNDRALRVLQRERGLTDRGGVLRAWLPSDTARLERLLSAALQGRQPVGGSMLVHGPAGSSGLMLRVNPVTARREQFGAIGVAAVVLIEEPLSPSRLDAARVATVLGLTPMEGRVAVALARGRTVREVAAAAGRQESTVRTHLRQIYRKLSISRRAELARLVLWAGAPSGSGRRR